MKRINILFFDPFNVSTGGDKWEKYLYDKFEKSNEFDVKYIPYDMFISKSKWLYPFFVLKKINVISDCDILFFSSSSTPSLFLLHVILYLLYPNLKIYVVHHHFAEDSLVGLKKIIYKITQDLCLSLSEAIVTPNVYVKKQIEKKYPKKKIVFLEMAFKKKSEVDVSVYHKYNLLYVGTVYERKGLIYLIEAISLLSPHERDCLKLDIVGNISSDKYYQYLKKEINAKNLSNNINFIGRVSNEKLEEYYKSAYCFVFPSLLEGYGMVLVEAMSYALPVIAFNNSAIPFTVKDGINGILVRNKDSKDLACCIERILTNTKLHYTLANGALDTYKNVRSMNDLDDDINCFIKIMSNF